MEELYVPPPKGECEERDWWHLEQGFWLHTFCWYQKKGKGLKLVNFYIAVHLENALGDREGRLLVSVDCCHHGTCHLHNEVEDSEHENRENIATLRSRSDVEMAYLTASSNVFGYAESVLHKMREAVSKDAEQA